MPTVERSELVYTQIPKFPKAEGYNLQVGSAWYRTVAGPGVAINLGTRDSLAERTDDTGSTYDNVLDIGYAWGRTDCSGGEGLDWDPRQIALDTNQAALDPIRFWDSEGIFIGRPEAGGVPYSLRLARATQDWNGNATQSNYIDLGSSAEFIFIAHHDTVTWYSSWDVGDIVATAIVDAGVDLAAIAVAPNNTVMAVTVDGDIYVKESNVDTFALAYDGSTGQNALAKGCWYTQGRFMASFWDDITVAALGEMAWNSTDWTDPPIEVDTASSPFYSVVESGPAIVAACGDGTVRTYTPNNLNAGDMGLHPRARTTMPIGESPILLGSNSNVLLIMTTANREEEDRQEIRMYQAEVLPSNFDYVVGQIQLRRQWIGAVHEPLATRKMVGTRDEILWYVKELREFNVLQESLWRMDIVTGGLSRIESLPDVNLNALVVFDEILGSIDFTGDVILISDPDLHQTFGWMIFPNITFGLNTDISWISALVEAESLVEFGGQVELWRSTNPAGITDWQHPSWQLITRLSAQGMSGTEIPLNKTKSRTLALQLRIKATNDDSISPLVTRTAIRGIPAHRDFIMMVPINISDYVSAPGRSPVHIPGLGHTLHNQMLDSVGLSINALLLEPEVLFKGIINNVSEPIEFVSSRGSVGRYIMVEFRGLRTQTATEAVGDSGIGLGLLGITLLGVGQSTQITEEITP